MKVSGIVIAKDSQELIEDCLKSLSFCDELIVVDGGSKDQTVALAKKMGAIVIPADSHDFAKQREEGMKKAKGEWLLYIDTDERVSDTLRKNIQSTILSSKSQAPNLKSAYRLQRQNFYLGNHPWPKTEMLERLFKKDALKGWKGQLHETAQVQGEIGSLEGYILHYTHRDLSSMLAKTIQWSKIEAQLRFEAHHPLVVWWRIPRVMIPTFWDSYIRQGGWRVGTVGLIESLFQAFSMFVTYARLWEMQIHHVRKKGN